MIELVLGYLATLTALCVMYSALYDIIYWKKVDKYIKEAALYNTKFIQCVKSGKENCVRYLEEANRINEMKRELLRRRPW